ncbi:MAG: hypothetical protein JWO36_1358 [Myxococcales bacterium]|nr:hypothetical protein [Myxococcales bacterium]
MRSVVPRLVGLILCVGTSVVHADTGTLPGGATLTFNRTFIHEANRPATDQQASTPDALLRYFNAAHCSCAQPLGAGDRPDFFEKTFGQELVLMNSTMPISRPLEFWGGVDCDMEVERNVRCAKIAPDLPMISNIATAPATVEVNTFSLINAKPGQVPCDPETAPANSFLWAMADTDGNSSIDFAISKSFVTDIKPPPLPTNFHAQGAEGAIEITWTAPSDSTDIFYYQALCTDASGTAPVTTNPQAAQYVTPKTLCGANALTLTPITIDTGTGPDAGVIAEPEAFATQDPTFICGEQSEKTATNLKISGLENGKSYNVALLVIDRAGNAAGVYFSNPLMPKPVTDFWEDLHNRGGKAEGGFCLIAESYGDHNPITDALRTFRDETLAETGFGRWLTHAYYASLGKLGVLVHGHLALRIIAGVLLLPLVAVALLWHALTLPGLLVLAWLVYFARRHRRFRIAATRLATVAAVACVMLASHLAHAQAPYWENQAGTDESSPTADQPQRINWHAGVRVGPYIPGIDKQLGMSRGPYQAMFGESSNPSAYAIMPMLDIERIVWRGFGQLGFGGSIGYMGKKARPFLEGSDPSDPNRPRSTADWNSFRLIPLYLNAVYRFSYLDDEYGVPLVPYVRAGLAYDIWWANQPSGDFASVCKGGVMSPCMQNKAAGASLGIQGSLGLSIRAERIDATATQSMHNSGIEHAGIYAEYQLSKIDGFGSSTKLSVGDNTWFAGVDFEF